VSCSLLADGAICTVASPAGSESRCFRILLGNKRTGTVIESDESCSGPLARDEKRTVAVRFPKRPALVCGPDVEQDCATKVLRTPIDEGAAAAWQAELRKPAEGGAAGGGGGGAVDCKALALHVFELRLEEELSYASSDEERANVESWMEADKPYILEDNEAACQSAMSAEQAECMMRAAKYDDLRMCWEMGGE
jgi:hypothetical protein